MAEILISARTAAATALFSTRKSDVPVTIKAFGMAAGDTVDIQMVSPDQTAEDAYEGGDKISLAYQSKTLFPITAPGIWKVDKGITTGTVQIELSRNEDLQKVVGVFTKKDVFGATGNEVFDELTGEGVFGTIGDNDGEDLILSGDFSGDILLSGDFSGSILMSGVQ